MESSVHSTCPREKRNEKIHNFEIRNISTNYSYLDLVVWEAKVSSTIAERIAKRNVSKLIQFTPTAVLI